MGVVALADGKRGDLEALLTENGATKSGDHQGASLFVDEDGGDTTVVAVTDDAVVIADGRDRVVAALDAHASGGDATLAGTSRFADAIGKLPQDVFGQMYLDVGALAQSGMASVPEFGQFGGLGELQNGVMAASLLAEPDGLRIKGVTTGVEDITRPAAFSPALVSQVPADTLAYFEVADVSSAISREVETFLAEADPEVAEQARAFAASIPQMLGVTIDQLIALGSGQQALAVLPGAGEMPGIAILSKVDDGAQAQTTINAIRDAVPQLLSMFGGSQANAPAWKSVSLPGGVTGSHLVLDDELGVVLAVSGDLVVVASSPAAAAAVLKPDTSLADAPDFSAGTAGMPDSVEGLSWINITEGVAQAGRAGAFEDAPAETLANLRPLRSAAGWVSGGDEPTFEAFIRISE